MGIPLAALSVNPPQPGPNVLDQATRAFQLRQAMQQAPLQQQAAQQQVQTGALENQQRQQQLAQTQALNQAYTGAITQGDDGKPAIDWNAVTKGLATKGQGSLIPSVMKTSQEYQKTQNDLNEAQQKMQAVSIDHMGNIGAVIKASNYDPDMAMTFLEQGKAGAPPQEQARLMALEQQIRQNPALVKQYADQLIAQSPKQRELQSAEEQAAARKAVADTGTKKLEAEMPGGPLSPATLAGQEATARVTAESSPAAIRAAATKAGAEQARIAAGGGNPRAQQSYQFADKQLTALATPVQQRSERIARIQDTLAQGTPQADALVAPELLSVMAGGQASGLRMNEAEIARIVGGRTAWENLKAAVGRYQINPNKGFAITPAQRQQVSDLFGAIKARNDQKLSAITQAGADLAVATDPMQHRKILNDVTTKLNQIDAQPSAPKAPVGGIQVTDPRGVVHTFPDQKSADSFKKAANIQ